MKNVLTGFKDFVVRGNVIDLAVGIIIGAAFSDLVTSLVDGFFSPLIAMLFGEPDLTGVFTFTINGAEFSIGLILTALLNLLFIAAALYFCVVLPINHMHNLRKRGLVAEPASPSEDVLLLQQIRDLLAAQNGSQGASGQGDPVPSVPPARY